MLSAARAAMRVSMLASGQMRNAAGALGARPLCSAPRRRRPRARPPTHGGPLPSPRAQARTAPSAPPARRRRSPAPPAPVRTRFFAARLATCSPLAHHRYLSSLLFAAAAPRAARALAAAAAPRADAAAPAAADAAAPAAAPPARAPGAAPARAAVFTGHPANNVTEHIYSHMGAGLHRRAGHPLCTLRDAIYAYFEAAAPGRFRAFDDLHPIVSTAAVRWGWRLCLLLWAVCWVVCSVVFALFQYPTISASERAF
jgi:hypothetical protein